MSSRFGRQLSHRIVFHIVETHSFLLGCLLDDRMAMTMLVVVAVAGTVHRETI